MEITDQKEIWKYKKQKRMERKYKHENKTRRMEKAFREIIREQISKRIKEKEKEETEEIQEKKTIRYGTDNRRRGGKCNKEIEEEEGDKRRIRNEADKCRPKQSETSQENFLQKIWNGEELQEGWKTGIISTIFKKGNKNDPASYKRVTLLDTLIKYTPIS